jgi:hypothetical protein
MSQQTIDLHINPSEETILLDCGVYFWEEAS